MKNWLQRTLKHQCSGYKWYRKWVGGYWQFWGFSIPVGDIWLDITKEQAFDPKYRPGCGFILYDCEYYPIGYFGPRKFFTEEVKEQLIRQRKLERLCNQN